MKLNSQLAIRLVLRNAFLHDDPDLTNDMQELYKQCPNLFRRALARTDRNELEALEDQVEFRLDVFKSASETHHDPVMISKIPAKEVRNSIHCAQGDGPLPLQGRQAYW